jgi:hypothetical protein
VIAPFIALMSSFKTGLWVGRESQRFYVLGIALTWAVVTLISLGYSFVLSAVELQAVQPTITWTPYTSTYYTPPPTPYPAPTPYNDDAARLAIAGVVALGMGVFATVMGLLHELSLIERGAAHRAAPLASPQLARATQSTATVTTPLIGNDGVPPTIL